MEKNKLISINETVDHIQKILEKIKVTSVSNLLMMNFLDVQLDREIEVLYNIITNKWSSEDYDQFNKLTKDYVDSLKNKENFNNIRKEIEKLYDV